LSKPGGGDTDTCWLYHCDPVRAASEASRRLGAGVERVTCFGWRTCLKGVICLVADKTRNLTSLSQFWYVYKY